ncbi:hypothetical protein BKA70DRAFT_1422067 [Coprinopsis sp. MPI-PUGE-AT-0042]|nr:hypothetical protein BKA70DRAFT_1422067 [Coprinopsis sp. MPI-PUGE-AT-0042]
MTGSWEISKPLSLVGACPTSRSSNATNPFISTFHRPGFSNGFPGSPSFDCNNPASYALSMNLSRTPEAASKTWVHGQSIPLVLSISPGLCLRFTRTSRRAWENSSFHNASIPLPRLVVFLTMHALREDSRDGIHPSSRTHPKDSAKRFAVFLNSSDFNSEYVESFYSFSLDNAGPCNGDLSIQTAEVVPVFSIATDTYCKQDQMPSSPRTLCQPT